MARELVHTALNGDWFYQVPSEYRRYGVYDFKFWEDAVDVIIAIINVNTKQVVKLQHDEEILLRNSFLL